MTLLGVRADVSAVFTYAAIGCVGDGGSTELVAHGHALLGCSQDSVQIQLGVSVSRSHDVESRRDLGEGADELEIPASMGIGARAVVGREDTVGR